MSEQTSAKKSNLKTIFIVTVGVIVALIIAALLMPSQDQDDSTKAFNGFTNKDGHYVLGVINKEMSTISTARLAIAQSAVDGNGVLSEENCNKIGSIAKKFNEAASWFASCSNFLYGATPDTDRAEVLKLSDGDYCATFTLDKEGITVTNYDFSEGKCGNVRISIATPDATN